MNLLESFRLLLVSKKTNYSQKFNYRSKSHIHVTVRVTVTYSVSPGRSPLRGNLTGLSRKVKDTCVSLHDYVQKWKLLIVKGVDIISQISNKKVAMMWVLFS